MDAPPTLPGDWEMHDALAYLGGLVKRHSRHGTIRYFSRPCSRCGEGWRYLYGGCMSGGLWRCLHCGQAQVVR